MEENTLNIIGEYFVDSNEMDLGELEIEGVLDMKKFKKLTKLTCSFNSIKKIVGLSKFLEYLDCSNNQLSKLGKLHNCLIYLDCSKNRIKSIDGLADTVRELNCSRNELSI